MTKEDFLKNFVTDKRVKEITGMRDDYRRVNHAVLVNGWKMPVALLAKLKTRLFPIETEIFIYNIWFGSDTAILITYPSGHIKLNARALKAVL
jgi:hypothetical protein